MKHPFPIYTSRWGHYDHHEIEWTPDGWSFPTFITESANRAEPDGRPAVVETLEHECVGYPKVTEFVLEELWEMRRDGELSEERLGAALAKLAEWISDCERSKPAIEGIIG